MGRLIFGDDILPLLCHTHGRKGVKSEFGTSVCGYQASPTQTPSLKCSKSSSGFLSLIKKARPHNAALSLVR